MHVYFSLGLDAEGTGELCACDEGWAGADCGAHCRHDACSGRGDAQTCSAAGPPADCACDEAACCAETSCAEAELHVSGRTLSQVAPLRKSPE